MACGPFFVVGNTEQLRDLAEEVAGGNQLVIKHYHIKARHSLAAISGKSILCRHIENIFADVY